MPHPAPLCGETLSPNMTPCLGWEGTCTFSQSGSGGDSGLSHTAACWSGRGHQAWNTVALLFHGHSFGHKHESSAQFVRGNEAWNTHHGCAQVVRGHHVCHTRQQCLVCEGASGLLNTPWQCPVHEGHWHSTEVFLLALKSLTHRLPPTQFIFCCWGGREGGLPCALLAVWVEAMATPGMVCSLPAGPQGPSAGPPSPWEHQGSCCPHRQDGREEGKGGTGVDRQRRRMQKAKQGSWCGRGNALVAAALLPLVFPYRLLPKPLLFPKGVTSVFLS